MLRILTPWDSQPQEAVGVDWGNPTASGLVFAWEGSVPSHDLRSSVSTIPFSTGISSSASTHGRTVAFSGSQANQSFGLSAFNGLAAATGATYDILVYFSGSNPTAKFFSQWDLGGAVQRWTMECSSGNLVWVAGDTDGGGASRSRFDLSGAFPTAGWYRITASWGGAGVNSLWINGTKRSPTTVGSGCTVINSTTMGLFIGGSGSTPLNGAVAFARIWRRGLQDAEIASIQNSGAWQLFAPRTIWVPVSAGGGGASISGALGAAVANGFTGTINANRTIAGALGAATASGFTGTVSNSTNTAITGALGVAAASGFKGTVGANRGIAGALGVAVASGFTGAVTNDNSTTISGALGTATASGFTGAITWNRYIAGLLGEAQASGFAGGVQNGAAPVIASGGGIYPTPRRKTKQEIDEDRKRLGILPDEPEIQTGIVDAPKRPTITLARLIGKPAADTHRADMERASAAHKLRKRRQDDDLLMMM